jgi:hypothetical protein
VLVLVLVLVLGSPDEARISNWIEVWIPEHEHEHEHEHEIGRTGFVPSPLSYR